MSSSFWKDCDPNNELELRSLMAENVSQLLSRSAAADMEGAENLFLIWLEGEELCREDPASYVYNRGLAQHGLQAAELAGNNGLFEEASDIIRSVTVMLDSVNDQRMALKLPTLPFTGMRHQLLRTNADVYWQTDPPGKLSLWTADEMASLFMAYRQRILEYHAKHTEKINEEKISGTMANLFETAYAVIKAGLSARSRSTAKLAALYNQECVPEIMLQPLHFDDSAPPPGATEKYWDFEVCKISLLARGVIQGPKPTLAMLDHAHSQRRAVHLANPKSQSSLDLLNAWQREYNHAASHLG